MIRWVARWPGFRFSLAKRKFIGVGATLWWPRSISRSGQHFFFVAFFYSASFITGMSRRFAVARRNQGDSWECFLDNSPMS